MKKYLPVITLILIVLLTQQSVFASKKTTNPDKASLSLKLNGFLFNPGQKIKIDAIVKPRSGEIKDVRTTIKITSYAGRTLFKRTFYKNKITDIFDCTVNKNAYRYKPGGYKIFAKVSSYQKTLKKAELDFGIAATNKRLNLILIQNISSKPLLDNKGVTFNYTRDTIEKLSVFKPVDGHIYYSVSPLLLDELKSISRGTQEKINGKNIKIAESNPLPQKAKAIYSQLIKVNKLPNSIDQTYSIADISRAPENNINWQTSLAGNNPLLTNSAASKNLAEKLKSKTLFFKSSNFTFGSYASKKLIGINDTAGKKLSGFSSTSFFRFMAFSAVIMANSQDTIVVQANGIPSEKYQKSMINNLKKNGAIKLINIPSSMKTYKPVKLKNKKILKTKLYTLIENFELMTNPKSNYLKSAINNYLKYQHNLCGAKTKNIFRSATNNLLKKQFEKFSLKPQAVTLTSANGKIPIGLSSKANYDANLKVIFKTKDFKTPKSLTITAKPKENVIIIPVTALYSGSNKVRVIVYAGKQIICKDTVTVNVILPSTVYFYLYIFAALIITIIISAFIFREVRHRKIGATR